MALKGERDIQLQDDVTYFMNQVAERGQVVVFTGVGGSGAALDQSLAQVALPTFSGGVPVGILLNDVVNKDLTQTHLNYHKNEVQIGNKVAIATRGWVVTNHVSGTPTIGQTAYYQNGYLTPSNTGSRAVGIFWSTKDENGYAKVQIQISNT